MKRIFYSMMAVAAMFASTSCSNEDFGTSGEGNTKVTFTANLEGQIGSRAYAAGETVDKVKFMAYDDEGKIVEGLTKTVDIQAGRKASVDMKLATGKTYSFAFFAYKDGANYYNLDDLKNVKVLNPTAYAGNEEGRDAFCAAVNNYKVSGAVNEQVTLKRPFAQINVITKDIIEAKAAGFDLRAKVAMTVKDVYSQYNVLAGDVVGESNDLTIERSQVKAGESITIGDVIYTDESYIAMNYVLVPANRSIVNCHIAIVDNSEAPVTEFDVPNAPVQANYRTNIMGKFFTDPGHFDIVIDPAFETPDMVADIWDGEATAEPTLNAAGEYEISTAAQLAGFAKNYTAYNGKTVKLMNDISLGNKTWTAVGSLNSYYTGIFDGQNHTIYDLNAVPVKVKGAEAAGLFGAITGKIKNLTVKNAIVASHHYAGAISGYSTANVGMEISNCHVDGAVITSSVEMIDGSYDNGDKVGGIIGYCVSGDVVTGCSVKNSTIKGYRDLGGIVGSAAGTITNNNVENVTLIQNLTNGYKATAPATLGAIIGSNLGATESGNKVTFVSHIFEENGSSATSLKNAITNAEALGLNVAVITLGKDAKVEWETGAGQGSTPFVAAGSSIKTIVINGGTLTATGNGIGAIGAANGAEVRFNNVAIFDKSVSYAENSWEHGYLEFRGVLRFTGCTFTGAILLEDNANVEFQRCNFNSNKTKEYAVWLHDVAFGQFYKCNFTGPRGLKMHEAYGSRVEMVDVIECSFTDITEKPGVVIGTMAADSSLGIKNSTFTRCQPGDQNKYSYESDTDISSFKFTEELNNIINN